MTDEELQAVKDLGEKIDFGNILQRFTFVLNLRNMVGPCMYDTKDDEENGVFTVKFITGGEVKFNYIPKHEEKNNNDTQCD